MQYSAFSNLRLANQHVTLKKQTSVQGLVEYLGAVQAQDYPMAKWALGVRLENITDKDIESALNRAEILRIHVLRPTWHMVSAKDIHWMLKLSAPHIRSNTAARHRQLDLNDSKLSKFYQILETSLRDNNHLTRHEIYSIFHQNKISTKDNRGAHILMCAELEGLICSGVYKGKNTTFALLAERAPSSVQLSRDESLARLAQTYFNSRGPATLRDFIWWSGLPVRDARKALAMIENNLQEVNDEDDIYYLPDSSDFSTVMKDSVLLLPAFDEFLIAYTNRKVSINDKINKKAISNNGVFRPVIVVNGQVVGIWKRTSQKNKVFVEVTLLKTLKNSQLKKIEKEVTRLGKFLGKEIVLIFNP